jgi:hypothetical protein
MLRCVALVSTYVSKKLGASIIRVTRIGELWTTVLTSNRRTLRKNFFVGAKFPPKLRFLQEPHGVTSQKTPFFISKSVFEGHCINIIWRKSSFNIRVPDVSWYWSVLLRWRGSCGWEPCCEERRLRRDGRFQHEPSHQSGGIVQERQKGRLGRNFIPSLHRFRLIASMCPQIFSSKHTWHTTF